MSVLLTLAESAETALPGGGSTMDGIISSITTAVKGIYGLAGEGFNFIATNPLCMVMVGLSFAGAGLGLVGRAFKTSRR